MKEPFLEPFLRKMRVNKVMPTILHYPDCRLLDIGCGWDYRLLKTVEPFIGRGVGIDFKVRETESMNQPDPRVSYIFSNGHE
jgi:hypothetical protein